MTKLKALEAATAEYAEKLKAIFGEEVKAEIDLEGVKLTDIAEIATEVKDEDGNNLEIKSRLYLGITTQYIIADIKSDNYLIDYITE